MWDIEMVIVLRHMIDDLANPPKYTDDRLRQLILVSAQFAQRENVFENLYKISLDNYTLSPDPTKSDTRDDSFFNLTLLKAACMLARSGLMKSAGKSLSVKEGPYSFNSNGRSENQQKAIQDWCQAYKDAQWDYVSATRIPGSIVIGPYRSAIGSLSPREYR